MHLASFDLARLEASHRLWNRHLEHHDLSGFKGRVGNAVPGLNDGRLRGFLGGRHTGNAGEELADADRIGCVIGALIDHLEDIRLREDAGGDLYSARTPT